MESVLAILQYVVIPAATFAAGLFSKWFLQTQKARDNTLRALAPERARAFITLTSLTGPFAPYAQLNKDQRRTADINFRKWYYDNGGSLFLSWRSAKRYLLAIDALRDPDSSDKTLERVFSRLRSQLRRDCGIYSWWNAWRQLPRPREPLAG